MTEWMPIESAPKDGSFILLCAAGLETGPVTIGAYYRWEDRDSRGRFAKGGFEGPLWDGWLGMDADHAPSWCEPTHWMPLPEPPSANAEKEDEPQR